MSSSLRLSIVGAVLALQSLVAVGADVVPLAITNVRIVDGTGAPAIEHGTIVITDGRIAAAGDASHVALPAGSRRLDAGGRTAIPGLADLHVHLLGGTDGVGLDILGYQKYLDALLYSGVTTVLDTGNVEPFIIQLRAEVTAGRVRGPHIYCVGPILDSADPVWPALSTAIASKDQVPRIVGGLAAQKVDFIKLYVGLSDQLVRTISSEAAQHHVRTIIDQWSRNGSADIAGEGIAGFAHFPSHRIGDDAIAAIKAGNVFFISTLAVQESATGRRWLDLSFLDDPLIADTTPKRVLNALRKEYGGLSAEQLLAKSDFTNRVDLAGAEQNVRRFRDAGILFAAGTDAVYPGDFQGEGLHRELELLVESGLTPLEAITTATRNAAAVLGALDRWGTLEAGKRADLVLVDGRPDVTIHDTHRIYAVFKDGQQVDRAALRSAIDKAPDYREYGSSMESVWH
jgi:imidazolonepropionase-like amidohydrolase